ncbi:MAG: DotG/IcmE/VirB10 family protein, partial [Alphaproteobacteria bacterium]|nr:DotG/IcmE/VirB10 family protein [Alphaproteobacteria bacterium]
PLQRWRRLQEERLQRELAQAKIVDARGGEGDGASAANSQAIQALSESLSGQMQIVLQTKTEPRALSSMEVTSPMILQSLFEEEAAAAQGGGSVAGATNAAASPEAQEIVLLPAGQIAYAQLITEANSDVPGPVLAQIVSGPLAGSRALGSFEVQKELLTLTFDKVIIKGVPYPANAIALDPGTTLPGMATEVDHRYFERVLLPMAASFVEGAARAVSESGLTSVTVEGSTAIQDTRETDTKQEVASGIEEAGEKLGEILDEQADAIEILVKIHAGTPVGLLFLDSVTKPAAQPQAAPVEDGQNSAVENLRRRLYGSR